MACRTLLSTLVLLAAGCSPPKEPPPNIILVLVDALRRDRGRVAYAIPGPGRREDPQDWAVTAVPLLNTG